MLNRQTSRRKIIQLIMLALSVASFTALSNSAIGSRCIKKSNKSFNKNIGKAEKRYSFLMKFCNAFKGGEKNKCKIKEKNRRNVSIGKARLQKKKDQKLCKFKVNSCLHKTEKQYANRKSDVIIKFKYKTKKCSKKNAVKEDCMYNALKWRRSQLVKVQTRYLTREKSCRKR